MFREFSNPMELRAHHLYSLVQQHRAPRLTRAVKSQKLALLGYDDKEFADHIVSVVDGLIDGRILKVRLTADYDEICKKCPQRGDQYCNVAGKRWPSVFLSLVDRKVAENSGLKIGEVYDSDELIQGIGTIRSGISKTLIQTSTSCLRYLGDFK